MKIEAQWVNQLNASADYLNNGMIEVPKYQDEIYDIVRRSSLFLQRVAKVEATGAIHRFFEETAIGTGTFNDPRSLSPVPTGPTIAERAAFIKAITAQFNTNLFDKLVMKQQAQYERQVIKNIIDCINAVVVTSAGAVWSGTDTSLSNPTTLQYMGLLRQITNTVTVTAGSSVLDALATAVANMSANVNYVIKPTAIYANPILLDALAREAKAARVTIDKTEVAANVKVSTVTTQAGDLPLIPEPFIPATTDNSYGFPAPPAGYKNYFAVIVSEPWIQMPYIAGETGSSEPMLWQLGLPNTLQGQFVAVLFNAVIAIGASYAHAIACIQLPQ